MTDEQKREWDAINELRKAAFERFNTRRKVEYQLLSIFWGATAALTLLILKGELKSWEERHAWTVTVVSIFSFLSFFKWTHGINRAHALDRKTSLHFEREMMRIKSLTYSNEIESALKSNESRSNVFLFWSHQLQLSVSILLFMGLLLVAWIK